MDKENFIPDEKISIRDVVLRVQEWIMFLLGRWLPIGAGTIIVAGTYITYTLVRSPVYTAETTFVIAGAGGESGVSSLASAVGVNFSSLESSPTWFTTDNILELYKSYRILKKTFFTYQDFGDGRQRLITRYTEKGKWRKKWNKEPELRPVTFEIPEDQMTQVHDSLLMVVLEKFAKRTVSMAKVSRKVSIISAKVKSKDPLFANFFNKELVKNVNEFYIQTKVKKAFSDVEILQRQRDSIKFVLDSTVARYQDVQNRSPNPNPFVSEVAMEGQRLQIDLESGAQAYKEIASQLEVAKIELLNDTPLIQIIDGPVLPLPDDKPKALKMVVLGILMGGVLMVSYFSLTRLYVVVMKEDRD